MPVLAVARNLVSAIRLLQVMPVFVDDPRVRIHWTIAPGSAYAAETDEYLARRGVRLTAWEQACALSYRLVIATSGNGELDRLDGPLMLLPHGAGYSRVVARGRREPAGLAPSQLMRDGRVLAALIGLEHEDQRARLAAYCPQAAPHGVVLGDPTRDRMDEGAKLRGGYREALDVSDRHALVLLSSTWGAGSLLDEHPELPARLAATLPYDEYRLAAIVHPNTAASLGAWEVGRLLLRSRAAGLRLIEPDRWESAVLAADLVIADHGSVALYAAAAGVRVLLGAYDAAQIVPDSPMAALAARLPRLRADAALETEIRRGLAQDVEGAAYRGARDAMGMPGESLSVTQREAYRLLELPAPPRAPRVLAPKPSVREARTCMAHLVIVERCAQGPAELLVRRFAVGVDPDLLAESASEDTEVCRHLAAGVNERDLGIRDNAEVLLAETAVSAVDDVIRALERVLAERDVCALVAGAVVGPGRCLVVLRDHGPLALRMDQPRLDAAVLPSILLALIAAEHGDVTAAMKRLHAGIPVRIGGTETHVRRYDPASVVPSSPC